MPPYAATHAHEQRTHPPRETPGVRALLRAWGEKCSVADLSLHDQCGAETVAVSERRREVSGSFGFTDFLPGVWWASGLLVHAVGVAMRTPRWS